jgi:hypothetical protein
MWEPQPLATLRASAACTGISLPLPHTQPLHEFIRRVDTTAINPSLGTWPPSRNKDQESLEDKEASRRTHPTFLQYKFVRSPCCDSPLINFQMPEPVLTRNLYGCHGNSAHLNAVLHKILSSVSVSVCVSPLSVARQWPRRIVCVVFYGFRVVSKERRRLLLPRTSCYISCFNSLRFLCSDRLCGLVVRVSCY